MAIAEEIKDKIVSFLGIMVVLIAVVQLMPTLQTSMGTGVGILTYALVAILISIGLLVFVLEAVL
jgi:hypothetical protein